MYSFYTQLSNSSSNSNSNSNKSSKNFNVEKIYYHPKNCEVCKKIWNYIARCQSCNNKIYSCSEHKGSIYCKVCVKDKYSKRSLSKIKKIQEGYKKIKQLIDEIGLLLSDEKKYIVRIKEEGRRLSLPNKL